MLRDKICGKIYIIQVFKKYTSKRIFCILCVCFGVGGLKICLIFFYAVSMIHLDKKNIWLIHCVKFDKIFWYLWGSFYLFILSLQENADDCGGASFIRLSASLLLVCVSFAALASWQMSCFTFSHIEVNKRHGLVCTASPQVDFFRHI